MRILVTGGAGHIGSRLIRNLNNYLPLDEIFIVDSMITHRYVSLFNLDNLPPVRFIDKDVRNLNLLEDTFLSRIDLVIHLAALTDASSSLNNSEELVDNNLRGTKTIAYICKSLGIPLVFPSSTSIYSPSNTVSWVDENCHELSANNPYSLCKIMEEDFLDSSSSGLNLVILRLGTIYGVSPGMRFHTAVNKFCLQAATGSPITVWETALDQLRPYLYIEDAVRAIAHIAKNGLFGGEVYNVVTENITVRTVLAEIAYHFERAPNIDLVKSEIMNTLSFDTSTKKLVDTNFAFYGSIKVGVNETLSLLNGLKSE